MEQNNTPLISIIVPVYNTEKYLDQCIQSVLAQTYTNWELLLIDDGSTDSSGAICDKYAAEDKRIRVFHKENGGVSSARNLGLDNAKGEWITFVDSDDWVDTKWLSNYLQSGFDKYDLISQGFLSSAPLDAPWVLKPATYGVDFRCDVKHAIKFMYEHKILGYIWVHAHKREIIQHYHIRFLENSSFKEDEEFTIKYLRHCENVASISRTGYYYKVPNWSIKYKSDTIDYYLLKSKWENLNAIYQSEDNIIQQAILNDFANGLVQLILQEKPYDAVIYMQDFRKTLTNHIFQTPLNRILKVVIYLDVSGILSAIIVRLYYNIKHLFSR